MLLNFAGDILISAEHNIHIIQFLHRYHFLLGNNSFEEQQLRKLAAMKNLPVFEGSGTIWHGD